MWDLSCVDWEDRIREGRSLIPDLPLIQSEAQEGLGFFDDLCLPDVPGKPRLGDAAGQWWRDIVATSFGSWDPVAQMNFIRDIFVLAPKGSSKTSYGAGLALSVMLMNKRPRAEALFIGPTQAISDRAYEQAVGMIDESPDLKRRFRPRDHIKTIEDLVNRSEMKVKTFDLNILTGSILIFAHLDEVHLLGRTAYASKVIRQIRGGIDKTPEGKFLITTTQSDDIPAGAFKEELHNARRHRDGEFRGKEARPTLMVGFEFPTAIAKDPARWKDTANWPMVMPNLGRSVHISTLLPDWNSEKEKGDQAIRVWASQYLNIEMGVGMKTDGWPGAEFWARSEYPALTFDEILRRSDIVVVGIDGGGLDDLFGLNVLGRCRETRDWLSWSHAWCHKGVLERRQTIASRLQDFEQAGELTIVDDELDDISAIVGIIETIKDKKILAAVAVDPAGLGEFIEALAEIGLTPEAGHVLGAPQGYAMMNAIKTTERKLANGTLKHSASNLMQWAVGNLKIEPTATAIRATKANAGDAKIDPVMALFDAVTVMVRNPAVVREPEFQMIFV
ncbi:MAG: Terminase [Rhizobium sp.]|nr:Terminase [Rhizobium sp.]